MWIKVLRFIYRSIAKADLFEIKYSCRSAIREHCSFIGSLWFRFVVMHIVCVKASPFYRGGAFFVFGLDVYSEVEHVGGLIRFKPLRFNSPFRSTNYRTFYVRPIQSLNWIGLFWLNIEMNNMKQRIAIAEACGWKGPDRPETGARTPGRHPGSCP